MCKCINQANKQGNNTILGVSGTGFFIDDEGTFLTACHVIDNVPPGSDLIYCGNIPFRIIGTPITIQEEK